MNSSKSALEATARLKLSTSRQACSCTSWTANMSSSMLGPREGPKAAPPPPRCQDHRATSTAAPNAAGKARDFSTETEKSLSAFTALAGSPSNRGAASDSEMLLRGRMTDEVDGGDVGWGGLKAALPPFREARAGDATVPPRGKRTPT
mmetsp:Transcript_59485/g.121259  ORF Transcript_59485/g.121259 Transcript_59485/m.121259 type:complete len:148 (+) Transcript_59485:635-1078(+)